MSFIPKDYDKATAGNYMKFEKGGAIGVPVPHKVRILQESILGYEYWVDKVGNVVPRGEMAGEGGKPIRAERYDGFEMEQRNAMKGFAAMVVWNYKAEKIQILQIKQSKIMNGLEALENSESWGDVKKYDIVINRIKTGAETKNVDYSVMPEPAKPLTKEIKEAFKVTPINLKALYSGDDPFDTSLSEDESDEIIEQVDVDINELLKEGK